MLALASTFLESPYSLACVLIDAHQRTVQRGHEEQGLVHRYEVVSLEIGRVILHTSDRIYLYLTVTLTRRVPARRV